MTAYIPLYINGNHDKAQRGGGGGFPQEIRDLPLERSAKGLKSRKGPSACVKWSLFGV